MVESIMLTFCASVGGGVGGRRIEHRNERLRRVLDQRQFFLLVAGMKLDRVTTRATCGRARNFAAT